MVGISLRPRGPAVVGEAGSGEEALAQARSLTPDVILMDLNMPRLSGLELLDILKEEGFELEERAFTVEEAKRAREVFVTAASSFVMPLVSLDGARIGDGRPGPVAMRLRDVYLEQARREAI